MKRIIVIACFLAAIYFGFTMQVSNIRFVRKHFGTGWSVVALIGTPISFFWIPLKYGTDYAVYRMLLTPLCMAAGIAAYILWPKQTQHHV